MSFVVEGDLVIFRDGLIMMWLGRGEGCVGRGFG